MRAPMLIPGINAFNMGLAPRNQARCRAMERMLWAAAAPAETWPLALTALLVSSLCLISRNMYGKVLLSGCSLTAEGHPRHLGGCTACC